MAGTRIQSILFGGKIRGKIGRRINFVTSDRLALTVHPLDGLAREACESTEGSQPVALDLLGVSVDVDDASTASRLVWVINPASKSSPQ